MDLINPQKNKPRTAWGADKMLSLQTGKVGVRMPGVPDQQMKSRDMVKMVQDKVVRFMETAVYPQQLTFTRYSEVPEGTSLYQIVHGREVDGIQEQGVRAFVLENKKNYARFLVSPLMPSEHDARAWASSLANT